MSAAGTRGTGPPERPRDPTDGRGSRDLRAASQGRSQRQAQAPYFPADDEADRHRTRIISSSPLKRIEEEEREQQRRQESARFGLRLTVMGLIVLVAFSAVVVRLWSLQVLHSSHYRNAALVYQDRTVPLAPTRGLIIARDGQVLVGDQVLPVVALSRATATPVVIGRLAALLGETVAQVSTTLANPQASVYQPVPIAIGVSQSTIVYLSEHKSMFPGVSVTFTAERTYPYADSAAQVLGYIGDIDPSELHALAKYGYTSNDVIGQSGVEASYERWLRGRPGSQVIKVDALGNPVGIVSTRAPVSGDDVVLNLDAKLQQVVQSALTSQIARLPKADSGAAVVLNPETGAVLAMVSVPSYNPSWWVGGISYAHYELLTSKKAHDPLLNRAIQGSWAPGSTFKLVSATSALNDGLLNSLGGYINDPGSYQIRQPCTGVCTYYDNTNNGQHEPGLGTINVTTALTASDDVFFYTLGADYWYDSATYGQTPIQDVAKDYGLGELTGIDLPNEYSGQVDSHRLRQVQFSEAPGAFLSAYYGIGDNIEMAFGQGETLITPLQLAVEYGTFATGGTRYAPQVVNSVVSPSGKVLEQFKPRVMGHVSLPPGTYSQILAGLEGAIYSSSPQDLGTAYGTFKGYTGMLLAGKTGTATESSNTSVQPTALFVAFGPTPPATPRYVVAVVIDQAGYGAAAAAPVARQIFEYLTAHPIGPPNLRPPANAP